MLFLLSIFSDFFPSDSYLTYSENIGHLTISGNYWVHSVSFMHYVTTSDGSAIYCSQPVKIVIEDTIFFNCSTKSGYGGAIYANCDSFVFRRVCSSTCSSKLDTHFAYIAISNKSDIQMLSNVYCPVYEPSIANSLTFYYGKTNINSYNCSRNTAVYQVSLIVFNSVQFSGSFFTIANNHATGYANLYYDRGADHPHSHVNFFNNTQPSSCHIYNINSISVTFSNSNFFSYTSTLSHNVQFENCYIETNSGGNTKLSFKNVHFSTKMCEGDDTRITKGLLLPLLQNSISYTIFLIQ